MDEVTVRRWCDLCFAADNSARVEAVRRFEVSIKTPNATRMFPRSVDGCAKHEAQLQELWLVITTNCDIVGTAKSKPASPTPGRAVISPHGSRATCPLCGSDMRRDSYFAHLAASHKASVVQPKRCPDCRATAATDKGMVFHRKTHGYDYEAELLASIPKRGRKRGE